MISRCGWVFGGFAFFGFVLICRLACGFSGVVSGGVFGDGFFLWLVGGRTGCRGFVLGMSRRVLCGR